MFLRFWKSNKDHTARALLARGARLIDVRTAVEFADAHLPGALNVPLQELLTRTNELGPKQRPIVLYCRSGARSAEAARVLKSQGFTQVHDMGSMGNWPNDQ